VATLAYALKEETPDVRAVTANVIYSAFRSPWGPDLHRGAVSDADADALLSATLALPKAQARQAIPAAVHASMLSNRADALYAALDKSSEAQLRIIGYRYLMTHGRLDAFKKIQDLARDPSSAVVLAALESPENMYNWTTGEQAAICPWAVGLLADTRPAVSAKAASILSNCSGEFVDKLLDSGDAALKANTFSAVQLTAFRDLCSPARRAQPTGPTEAQCQRSRKLLEKVVDSKGLDEQARSTALVSLAYQWPDEETLKFARSLATNSDKSLAEHARRTVERLTQRLHAPTASSAIHAHPDTAKPTAVVAVRRGGPPAIGIKPPAATKPAAPPPAAPAPRRVNPRAKRRLGRSAPSDLARALMKQRVRAAYCDAHQNSTGSQTSTAARNGSNDEHATTAGVSGSAPIDASHALSAVRRQSKPSLAQRPAVAASRPVRETAALPTCRSASRRAKELRTGQLDRTIVADSRGAPELRLPAHSSRNRCMRTWLGSLLFVVMGSFAGRFGLRKS